jgi:hypothetical protein
VPDNGFVEDIIFKNGDYLQGENLKSLIGGRWRLCIVPFLVASLLESLKLRCYIGGSCIVAASSGNTVAGLLFLSFFVHVYVLRCCRY